MCFLGFTSSRPRPQNPPHKTAHIFAEMPNNICSPQFAPQTTAYEYVQRKKFVCVVFTKDRFTIDCNTIQYSTVFRDGCSQSCYYSGCGDQLCNRVFYLRIYISDSQFIFGSSDILHNNFRISHSQISPIITTVAVAI